MLTSTYATLVVLLASILTATLIKTATLFISLLIMELNCDIVIEIAKIIAHLSMGVNGLKLNKYMIIINNDYNI